jgi:hypothetical protein
MALRPAINDRHITSFHEALLAQAGLESLEKVYESAWRAAAEKADDRHRPLLGTRRERPICRRAAEQRDELAAPHSITSSARPSSVIGKVRPSALAVLRLITSSALVDCCTDRSAGLSPLRTRPT